MPLTRRSFLAVLGVGSAAAVQATSGGELQLPTEQRTHAVTQRSPARSPQRHGTTKLESFIKCRGIKPATLARESGYTREYLLRVRMGRLVPTPLGAVSIIWALRRLCREPVLLSRLFDASIVASARTRRKAVLREFHPFHRRDVRRCFA